MGGVTSEDVDMKYHILRFPSKSPVAMCLCWRDVAPNVPHFMGLGLSTWNTWGGGMGQCKKQWNSSKVGTSFNLDQLVDKSLKSKSVGNYKRNQKCFWQFLWPILTKHLPTNQTHAPPNLPTLFKCIVLTVIQLYVDVKQHTHRNTLTEV